jgi:AraC-like DNA-binding protein
MGRHHHERAFAAIVLSGGYVEAGDTGRHRVGPGSVLLHRRFEAHLHHIGTGGAEVLVLELSCDPAVARGRVDDPDTIARLGERDAGAASVELFAQIRPTEQPPLDWPDLLARDLARDPTLDLRRWADGHGLHPGSLSRGFRSIYDVSPAHYRLVQRTRRALTLFGNTRTSLAEVAALAGFSDQAHMSRAVRQMTGRTALQLKHAAGAPGGL